MHQSWNLSFLLHSHLPRMYKCISPRTTNSSSLFQYFIHREINSLVVTSNSFLLVSIPVEIKLLSRILLNKIQPSSVKQYWKIIYVLFLYFGTLFISLLWYLSSNLYVVTSEILPCSVIGMWSVFDIRLWVLGGEGLWHLLLVLPTGPCRRAP